MSRLDEPQLGSSPERLNKGQCQLNCKGFGGSAKDSAGRCAAAAPGTSASHGGGRARQGSCAWTRPQRCATLTQAVLGGIRPQCSSSGSAKPPTERGGKSGPYVGMCRTRPLSPTTTGSPPGHLTSLTPTTAVRGKKRYPPPPLCISHANVHNHYGPYAYCSLDKGVACAQHIQLPTHTCAG